MILLDIITNFILQNVFTIGLIMLFGFLIALCNKKFYANFGNYGRMVCYITGAVGTPIHECSHALFCLIFGHKIKSIKLFQINSADGTLGYVNHSYNPKNFYHKIGNFFIGVAPIIVISALLYLLAYLLLPEWLEELSFNLGKDESFANFGNELLQVFSAIPLFFLYAVTWEWWVFVIFGMFLSLHMTLSRADIKGALSGILLLIGAILIVDIVLGIVSSVFLNGFTKVALSIGSYLLCILLLALIISAVSVLISFIFRRIKR